MLLRKLFAVVAVLISLAFPGADSPCHAEGRWLPGEGRAAIHQRCLDLESPAVVMVLALHPGDEDLPLMAYLRFFQGVETVCVYLTNGEGTPGDTLSRFPIWVVGQRKLEADRVNALLGSEAWFVNMRDLPGTPDAAMLRSIWDSAEVTKRLTYAIRSFKPEVVVFCSDSRGEGNPTREDSTAMGVLRASMQAASTTIDTAISKGIMPWSVSRLYVEKSGKSLPGEFSRRHPLFRVSPMEIAVDAGKAYRTLRLQLVDRLDRGREYVAANRDEVAAHPTAPQELIKGLPHVSHVLSDVQGAIERAITTSPGGVRSADLTSVARAIDVSEHVLAVYGSSLSPLEQRLMVEWKIGLESLRCSLLGVSVKVTQGENLVTASQVWDLRIVSLKPGGMTDSTQIIFPLALNGDWPVNETLTYHFPLKPPQRFTVLTPPELPFVIPADMYGLHQPSMRTKFPYIIVHKDQRRERNFQFRGNIVLQTGPRRSFVLRTPLIYDDPSSPIIFALQNFSRDPYKGAVTLLDSSRELLREPVALKRKDEIVQDTLYLPTDDARGAGSHAFVVDLSGRGGERSVTARRFSVGVDSALTVGVLSGIDGSPLEDALRVLRQQRASVSLDRPASSLSAINVLLVDRDVSADGRCDSTTWNEVASWIRAGGKAVIFPQHGRSAKWLEDLCGCSYERMDPLASDAEITVESRELAASPNRLGSEAWDGWVESRAFDGIVEIRRMEPAASLVRSGVHSLVESIAVGKGEVTLVAADLISQLVNYHPGAYRLLSNLLSFRTAR